MPSHLTIVFKVATAPASARTADLIRRTSIFTERARSPIFRSAPTVQIAAGGYCARKSFAVASDLPKSAIVPSITEISTARSVGSSDLMSAEWQISPIRSS